jgi:hypothetical protein
MHLIRNVTVAAVIAFGVLVAGSQWLISSGVHAATEAALHDHPGDRVQALIAYVDSTNHTLRDRNRAAWALGRMGDPRALPVLQKHLTGQKCDHNRFLCQYELRKAIRLCRRTVTSP